MIRHKYHASGERITMNILKFCVASIVALVLAAAGITSCMRGGTLSRITVTPANSTIAAGTRHPLTATAFFTDGTSLNWTTAVVWASSDSAAMSVSNARGENGLASSLTSTGMFVITATDEVSHISGTTEVSVTEPLSIAITPANPHMAINTKHDFIAVAELEELLSNGTTSIIEQYLTSSPSITWSSSDTLIAAITSQATTSISGGNSIVTAGEAAGVATISVNDLVSGKTGTTTLTVTSTPVGSITALPADQVISLSTTTQQQFTATGNYSDSTTLDFTSSVTWHSSNTKIATVSNDTGSNGLVTLVAAGTATIKATDQITQKVGHTTLTITP